MTPHARKFSLFQASLKASLQASLKASFTFNAVAPSQTPSTAATPSSESTVEAAAQDHDRDHDRDYHSHHEIHDKKQRHHHHGHHPPPTRGGKKKNHGVGHSAEAPSSQAASSDLSVSPESEPHRTQTSGSPASVTETVQTTPVVEISDDISVVANLQSVNSYPITSVIASSEGPTAGLFDSIQTPPAEFFVTPPATAAVTAAVAVATPDGHSENTAITIPAETSMATPALDAALFLLPLSDTFPTAAAAASIATKVPEGAGVPAPLPTQQPAAPEDTDFAGPDLDLQIGVAVGASVAASLPTQQAIAPDDTIPAGPNLDLQLGVVVDASVAASLPTQQAIAPEDTGPASPDVDLQIGVGVGASVAASLPTQQAIAPEITVSAGLNVEATIGAADGSIAAASLPSQQAIAPIETDNPSPVTDPATGATGGSVAVVSLPSQQVIVPSVTGNPSLVAEQSGAAASLPTQQVTVSVNNDSAGSSIDTAIAATEWTSAAASLPTQQVTATAYNGTSELVANATETALSSISAMMTTSALPLTTSPLSALLPANCNSTSAHNYGNGTLSHSLFANSSRTSTSLSQYSSSTFSSSLLVSTTSSTYAGEATGVDGAGGTGKPGTTASAGSSTNSSDGPSTGPPTNVLVASVVGGLAGMAVLLIVVMALLKWKRKRDAQGHKLLGGGDNVQAALGGAAIGRSGSGGPKGPGGPAGDSGPSAISETGHSSSKGMSETRTNFLMPFASILTSGQKHLHRITNASNAAGPDASASTTGGGADAGNTERGFYKISGKKLPSVLQHGGDGYEDPRESVLSTNPALHRDSHGYFGGAGGPATSPSSRYAVGSPMRPQSGVPVFHNGPNKAVAMRAPLSRHGSSTREEMMSVRHLTPPAGNDPVGRSRTSQDVSRGSRFAEDIF
ncbi:hypothetical protein SEPCBS119000_006047 [Sporothrix epigloea]|uniref:Uncharacterized protein n=1 Tax=Sporothrix epigloea TaxID=1892477 RepID=A0ABP0E3D1_9PEZI